MATIEISKIKEDIPLETFDCGNASINVMVSKSYFPTILQHAYSYVVNFNNQVVGVYMLKFLKIILEDCPEDVSDYKSDICEDCFSIHIKYIAVKKEFQNKGIGTAILCSIVKSVRDLCKQWPVRFITLDALKDKIEWYKSLGFLAFNEADMNNEETTIKMYLDCLLDVDLVDNYCSSIV